MDYGKLLIKRLAQQFHPPLRLRIRAQWAKMQILPSVNF